jgi:Domain of unknown function (DUF4265)
MDTILVPPFFLKGISVGDVLKCEIDAEGYVEQWKHVKKSNRSTVWAHYKSPINWELAKAQLIGLGCNVETFRAYKLSSIDVPPSLRMPKLNEILVPTVESGGFMVFPSARHL